VKYKDCTVSDMTSAIFENRPTFASSSGASTSSSKQKVAGFSLNIADANATAVNALSPPDNKWMELFRLPGGRG
jgi:hypothetical protein